MEQRLPEWVKTRDGRVTPFDPDRITQALFAATVARGEGDAFLAREMTDGVIHFLIMEDTGEVVSSEQIGEVMVKVVRELGHPDLALLLAEPRSPLAPTPREREHRLEITYVPGEPSDLLTRRCLTEYSLRAIYASDLAAAHTEGLLRIGGLDDPYRLTSLVLEPPNPPLDSGDDMFRVMFGEVFQRTSRNLVVDSPEYLHSDASNGLCRAIQFQAGFDHRVVWVHVHAARPPAAAERPTPHAIGPLFGQSTSDLITPRVADGWFKSPSWTTVWHWHGEAADNDPALACLAQARGGILFDRPGKPIALGCGLSRTRTAVLCEIGLDLFQLLNRPEIAAQGEVFLEKIPSLVRMAVSAASQKRTFLRRHAPDLGRGFLLDRAAVRLVPLGLDRVVRQLLRCDILESKLSIHFAQQVLAALNRPLPFERRRSGLELLVAGPPESITLVGDLSTRLTSAAGLLRGLPDGIISIDSGAIGEWSHDDWRHCLSNLFEATEVAGIFWPGEPCLA